MPHPLSFRKNRFFADILIAAICLAGLAQIVLKAGTGVILGNRNGNIVVDEFKKSSGANPLRPGDRIRNIAGHDVATIADLEFILDGYAIGQTVSVVLERNGIRMRQDIELQRYNSTQYLIILFLVAPVFFSLGLFVLLKRPPGDRIALIFYWMCLSVTVYVCTTFGRMTTFPFFAGFSLRLIFLAASALTPVLFLHLSFLFPGQIRPNTFPLLRAGYAAALLYVIGGAVLLYRTVRPVISIQAFHDLTRMTNAAGWLFALFLVFGAANFIQSYRKAAEESERRKLRWIILGLAIAPLSFVSLWQIPKILSSVALVRGEVILISIAFIPIAFAISIVRYHVLDIDFIFNRSTVYALVFSFLMLIYASIVAAAAFFISVFTIRASIIVSAVAAVFVAILFEPARRAIQHFVDKKFFRVRYNYRIAQREFSSEISRFIDLKSLGEFVVRKVDVLLQPECIGLFASGDVSTRWHPVAASHLNHIGKNLQKELSQSAADSGNLLGAVSASLESGISHDPVNESLFRKNNIDLAIPLLQQADRTRGFLLLGPKKSRMVYSFEDVDLLKTVTALTGSAFERIDLQHDLLLKHAETERLNELNQLKSYFVSSVSHDLQTPLTSIRMFAEILQNKTGLSQKEKQEYLEIIQGESARLARLISNVLNFSRIERGIKVYHFEPVALADIFESVIRTMRYQIGQNGFKLTTKPPGREIILNADADAIAEMLTNLLDNAMKYSRDIKHIALSAFVEQNQAVIQVSDRGIGISPEDHTKIFDAFYRSDDEKVLAMGGAGLGLTQVRHIVEAHHGRIGVESEPGSGSTFSVFLPLGEAE